MRLSFAPLSLLFAASLLTGCGAPADDGSKSKLATDLVQCRNDQRDLKDQLALAKAELLKAQQSQTMKLDPIDATGPKHGGGPTSKDGNVSPDAIAKVVKLNGSGFRACYDKALKRKPDLQYISSVNARFSVRNTGNAQGVTFTPHSDADMEKCMSQLVERWKFPTFQGDAVGVEVPVSLVAH